MGVKGQGEHAKSLDAELIDVIRPLHPPESSLTGGLPLFDMMKNFWLFGVAPQAVPLLILDPLLIPDFQLFFFGISFLIGSIISAL